MPGPRPEEGFANSAGQAQSGLCELGRRARGMPAGQTSAVGVCGGAFGGFQL